jgi:hypothetical protein
LKIFVTGMHRAGTHGTAEYYAKKYGLAYIEESKIKYDSMWMVNHLIRNYTNDFVLQCPGLAHETETLSKLGKVIWCDRNIEHTVRSMINCSINNMAWDLMRAFMNKFPDDEIWDTLFYDGSRDFPAGFPKYYTLLIKVKRYFYETKFKFYAEKSILEELEPYDVVLANNQTIKPKAKRLMKEIDTENESLCLY